MTYRNINADRKGRTAQLIAAGRRGGRRLAADRNVKGLTWNDDGYYDDSAPIGLEGVITEVNSHGSAPFTRYNVDFIDGTSMIDAVEGVDIVIG